MNLQKVVLSFPFNDWYSDGQLPFEIPEKIQHWCQQYFPYNHSINRELTDDFEILVSITNVPKSVLSFIALTSNHIFVVETVEYAPIHPKSLDLFDFGDRR
jgi:hypothetical protein